MFPTPCSFISPHLLSLNPYVHLLFCFVANPFLIYTFFPTPILSTPPTYPLATSLALWNLSPNTVPIPLPLGSSPPPSCIWSVLDPENLAHSSPIYPLSPLPLYLLHLFSSLPHSAIHTPITFPVQLPTRFLPFPFFSIFFFDVDNLPPPSPLSQISPSSATIPFLSLLTLLPLFLHVLPFTPYRFSYTINP